MKLRRFRFGLAALTGVMMLGLVAAGPVDAASPHSTSSSARTLSGQRYIVTLRGLAPQVGRPRVSSSTSAVAAARATEAARVARVDQAIAKVASSHGIRTGTTYHYALQGFAATLTSAQVGALRNDPRVGSLTTVRPVYPAAETVPAGVTRIGADPPPGHPAPANLGLVHVAVLDTGIRYIENDPELNVNPTGIDCAQDGRFQNTGHEAWKDVDKANGHGTHVSGTIGAKNSGSGIVGVAPGVELTAVRIFEEVNGSPTGDTESVACGVDWVASTHSVSPPDGSHPIDVANMSIQGPRAAGDGAACPQPAGTGDAEHDAICTATDLGITFVVAAGNSSRDAANTVPAVYDSAITVSAMADYDGVPGALAGTGGCGDRDDSFASYSNYGASVDLIAPGSCVLSLGKAVDSTHEMSGTSMAAPHVTGAAARYVAELLAGGTPHDADHINAPRIKRDLRAAASLDWTTASDPDGTPDRRVDVAALETAQQDVNSWAFPALIKSGAPAGNPSNPVTSTISVELQRAGLYAGDVTITADANPSAGITLTPPATALSGLDAAGISTTVGVSVGPGAADGDAQITIHATPADGGVGGSTATVTLRIDRHKPVIQGFTAAMVSGATLGDAQAVRLSWTGSDPGGSVAKYEIQRQTSPSSAWSSFSLSPQNATSSIRFVPLKTQYAFRVRAIDAAGNASDWSVLPLRVGIRDSGKPAITYSANNSWKRKSTSKAYGGSLQRSKTAGAFAATSFNGRGIAWVAPVGPGKGTAKVYIDGSDSAHLVATVSLDASTQKSQRVIWASAPLAPGHHSLVIKVVSGTVDLDAILLLF